MDTPGLSTLRATLAAVVISFVSACAMAPSAQAPVALTDAQIAAIVNSPDRASADRENDKRRKPEQILGFIGLRIGNSDTLFLATDAPPYGP